MVQAPCPSIRRQNRAPAVYRAKSRRSRPAPGCRPIEVLVERAAQDSRRGDHIVDGQPLGPLVADRDCAFERACSQALGVSIDLHRFPVEALPCHRAALSEARHDGAADHGGPRRGVLRVEKPGAHRADQVRHPADARPHFITPGVEALRLVDGVGVSKDSSLRRGPVRRVTGARAQISLRGLVDA